MGNGYRERRRNGGSWLLAIATKAFDDDEKKLNFT